MQVRLRSHTPAVPTILGAALLILAAAGVFLPRLALAQAPDAEVCKNCHAASYESYQASIHGKKGHPSTPANSGGCVSCHANAAEHVKAGGGRGAGGIVNPGPRSKNLTAEQKSNVCLACHSDNRHLAFWDSGRHRKNDVSCSNCHNPHGGNPSLLNTENPPIRQYVNTTQVPQQEVCYTCHRDIRSLVMRPSHHPIAEGKVKCTSCHNPHGALSPNMVNAESTRELCVSCHADKRGPYSFEHPPVEENCLNCHNPHGSRSVKLLREKVPTLCQDCHALPGGHPGAPRDASQGFLGTSPQRTFIARSCLNCHNEIHGSNGPASRGRRFTR